jgi:hypothetical protein
VREIVSTYHVVIPIPDGDDFARIVHSNILDLQNQGCKLKYNTGILNALTQPSYLAIRRLSLNESAAS